MGDLNKYFSPSHRLKMAVLTHMACELDCALGDSAAFLFIAHGDGNR